jgi:hypothetical protein
MKLYDLYLWAKKGHGVTCLHQVNRGEQSQHGDPSTLNLLLDLVPRVILTSVGLTHVHTLLWRWRLPHHAPQCLSDLHSKSEYQETACLSWYTLLLKPRVYAKMLLSTADVCDESRLWQRNLCCSYHYIVKRAPFTYNCTEACGGSILFGHLACAMPTHTFHTLGNTERTR